MQKQILISGATGFLGRNLLEYYAERPEFNVRAIHFKREKLSGFESVDWCRCDLRDPHNVRTILEGIDIVLHFAAVTNGAKDILASPHAMVTDNAIMNSLLLREAHEQQIEHFIFPSCTIMYQSSDVALKESDFDPAEEIPSAYFGPGHTKVYFENMCRFFSSIGDTKYTAIRHSNIYGPHDKFDLERSHVTGATITKVMRAEDGKVVVWGKGEERRDLLYVDDFITFVDSALTRQIEQFELFNCGAGFGIRIIDLVEKIVELSGRELRIDYDLSKPTIPTSLFLDCEKAEQMLGWSPRYNLEEGLTRTIKWFESHYGLDVLSL